MDREEALKIVRENYPHFGTTEPWLDLEKALATLIPELRESEDERIRKAIIEHFKQSETEFPGLTFGGYYYADVLAYLEKQKEQKSITANDLDEEIHRFFDDCIDVHEVKLYGSISERVIPVDCYELTARHFAKWGEKQKEQEHICDSAQYEEGFKTGLEIGLRQQKEQKPAEWSEEDENALIYLHELIGFGFTEKFCDAQTASDMRMWLNTRLKSLRPSWKPSEEDEEPLSTF